MKFVLALLCYLGLSGCVIDYSPPAYPEDGMVEFCDDWGCSDVDAPHYSVGNDIIYWDVELGVWIGPRGYWSHGWIEGFPPGYHRHYDHFRGQPHHEHEHHEHHSHSHHR